MDGRLTERAGPAQAGGSLTLSPPVLLALGCTYLCFGSAPAALQAGLTGAPPLLLIGARGIV